MCSADRPLALAIVHGMGMCDNLLILLELCVAHCLRLCCVTLVTDNQCIFTILVMLLSFISTSYGWLVFRLIFIGALQQLETIADLRSVEAI